MSRNICITDLPDVRGLYGLLFPLAFPSVWELSRIGRIGGISGDAKQMQHRDVIMHELYVQSIPPPRPNHRLLQHPYSPGQIAPSTPSAPHPQSPKRL